MPIVTLEEWVRRESLPGQKVMAISSNLVIQIMADKSIIAYQDNGVISSKFFLSRDAIVAIEEATR
jgi:hypothetical protein